MRCLSLFKSSDFYVKIICFVLLLLNMWQNLVLFNVKRKILIGQDCGIFEFIYDRQEIWHRRNVLKLPAPWSTDEILRNYRFCNVYRELDGGTLALTKYLTDESISVGKKLFNIVAYRFFNRRDTIENLFGGLLDPENFDFEAFEARFDAKEIRRACFQTPI